MSGGFSKWGSGGVDTEWLRRAGFTRRNTRRAILDFLDRGLLPGETILHLTSGTYRLQMGFLAITDRRVVFGMSWAFLPFIKRRREIPYGQIVWVKMHSRPWGASVRLDSWVGNGALGNMEEPDADRLVRLISALVQRARAQGGGGPRAAGAQPSSGSGAPAPGGPENAGPRALSSPSGSLPSRPT